MKDPNRDLFDIAYINRNRRDRVRDGIFIGCVVTSFVSSIFIIAVNLALNYVFVKVMNLQAFGLALAALIAALAVPDRCILGMNVLTIRVCFLLIYY